MPRSRHIFAAARAMLCAAMPHGRRARPKQKMQPPLTPMIDVTFQLLIFFLLAFQLRQPEGPIPASLPGGPIDGLRPRPVHIVIQPVGDNDALYVIDRHPPTADPDEVYDVLQAQRQFLSTNKVGAIIEPHKDVQWRFVVEAFNAAVRAKLENVTFGSING